MGKGNKQTTTQNQTQSGSSTTVLPSWVTQQAQQNLGFGNNAVANWSPAMQQAPAGFSQDQINAFNLISGFANNAGANNPTNQAALNFMTQAGNWQAPQVYQQQYNAQNVADPSGYQAATIGGPSQVGTQRVTAQNMTMDPITAALMQAAQTGPAERAAAATGTASQIDPNSISRVTGPDTAAQLPSFLQAFDPSYQSDVINASLTDLDRARQMTNNQNAAQAAQAGAFGSSRQGVMESLTNADFARQAAETSANLRQSGFNTALSALQQQQGLGQQAALANQGVDATVAAQNAQLAQGMSLANVGNQQQTNLANQQAGSQFQMYNTSNQQQANVNNQNALNQIALANQQNNFMTQQGNQNANLQASLANAANALNAGEFNAGNQLQTQLANQSSLNNAGQFNAGQGFQAALANQSAQNQGSQFNSQQWLQSALANQSASQAQAQNQLAAGGAMGNMGQGMSNQQLAAYQALLGAGGQQQQYQQNILDTAYGNAQQQANAPLNQAMLFQQLLQNTPYGTTTNTTGNMSGTTTQQQQPGWAQILGMGLQGASMFMSDARLKENIVPVSGANLGPHMRDPLKAVRRIRTVGFNWKGDNPANRQLGLLAQNVERAAPEAVRSVPTGNPSMPTVKAIHTPAMLGLLTGAVNQLDQKISRKHPRSSVVGAPMAIPS